MLDNKKALRLRLLADNVKSLADGVTSYMTNLKNVTAERERIGTELDLATKIQASMLPNIFPPFPERTEFDIYATMTPAKEVGGMDGMRYKDYELTLEKGDVLFLYTDGVAEATNAANELFGTDRLLAVLNNSSTSDPKTLLENVKSAVDEFVGEAEQFDDLTMLSITMR